MDFNQFAHKYDDELDQCLKSSGAAEYFADHKALWLTRYLSSGFSGKILDFGCGVGGLSGRLASYFPDATLHGFDVSEDSIQNVPDHLKRRGLFTSEFDSLDNDYQLIVVVNVLHHIEPSDRPENLKNLVSRLSRSGRLIVFEHNPRNPFTRRVVQSCVFDKDAVLLPLSEVSERFTNAGLQIVRRAYIVFFPRSLRVLRPIENYLSWCGLGAQYVVVGARND